jgi:Fe2+ transport system protein FeoA
MDLGFVPGTLVEVAISSPFRDPTAYRVKGGLIALRKVQASKINISNVQY